jgi:hypothetical protein
LSSFNDGTKDTQALSELRERARARILSAIDAAETSLARGEGRIITQQSMRDLAGKIRRHGCDRLAAERPLKT